MKITATSIEMMLSAMTSKGMKQTQLAEAMGMDPGNLSRILNGKQESISDDLAIRFNEALGIDLLPKIHPEGLVSSTAVQLSTIAAHSPALSALMENLLTVAGGSPTKAFLPSVTQEQLGQIGEEAIRLAFMWEDGDETRKIKVGADLMTFIRELYRKGEA